VSCLERDQHPVQLRTLEHVVEASLQDDCFTAAGGDVSGATSVAADPSIWPIQAFGRPRHFQQQEAADAQKLTVPGRNPKARAALLACTNREAQACAARTP
jgi:hypothetical protein